MELFILIIAAFITSSISAVIGMGGGIILLGIMAMIIPEGYMVIALHGVIQLISNTTRTYVFKKHLKNDLIKQFSIGAFLGVGISVIYSKTMLLTKMINKRAPTWLSSCIGSASGKNNKYVCSSEVLT